MKILTTKKIKEIDHLTMDLHDFIHNLKNDSLEKVIEKRKHIYKLNEIRTLCDLPKIISWIHRYPMPEVKPPKKEECKHVYEIGFDQYSVPFLFCKHCAEIKRISLDEEAEQAKTKQKHIHIPIDEFTDICDSAATFKQLKELVIKRQALQEDES